MYVLCEGSHVYTAVTLDLWSVKKNNNKNKKREDDSKTLLAKKED